MDSEALCQLLPFLGALVLFKLLSYPLVSPSRIELEFHALEACVLSVVQASYDNHFTDGVLNAYLLAQGQMIGVIILKIAATVA